MLCCTSKYPNTCIHAKLFISIHEYFPNAWMECCVKIGISFISNSGYYEAKLTCKCRYMISPFKCSLLKYISNNNYNTRCTERQSWQNENAIVIWHILVLSYQYPHIHILLAIFSMQKCLDYIKSTQILPKCTGHIQMTCKGCGTENIIDHTMYMFIYYLYSIICHTFKPCSFILFKDNWLNILKLIKFNISLIFSIHVHIA